MKRICIYLFSFLFLGAAAGQTSVHFDFLGMKPVGSLNKMLEGKTIGGLSVGFNRSVKKNSPWEWGLNLGVGMYAYRSYYVWFVPEGQTESVSAEVYEDDCLVQYTGEARYNFSKNRVLMPYGIARIGGNSFFSHIDPVDKNIGYTSQFRWQGRAITTGLGFGTRINMNRLFGAKNPKRSIFFDINKTVNYGSATNYRYFKSQEAPHENLSYGVHHTTTSFSNWHFGLGFMW